MAQRQDFQSGPHFRHFPDFADVERCNPNATPRFGNSKPLSLQSPECFAHRHMAGLELFGNVILSQFRAGLDLTGDDAVGKNAADTGCDGFAGGVLGGLNHEFIDNPLCLAGRAILLLLTEIRGAPALLLDEWA